MGERHDPVHIHNQLEVIITNVYTYINVCVYTCLSLDFSQYLHKEKTANT